MTDKLKFKAEVYKPFINFWLSAIGTENNNFLFRQLPPDPINPVFEKRVFYIDKNGEKHIKKRAGTNHQMVMVIVTSFIGFVLSKYTNRQRVVVKTPLYKKDINEALNINDVPLCMDVDLNKNIHQFLNYHQIRIKGSYKYQNFPLEMIYNENNFDKVESNTLVCFENMHNTNGKLSNYDLKFTVQCRSENIKVEVTYNLHAFQDFFVVNLMRHLNNSLAYLKDLSTRLNDIVLISPEEEQKFLVDCKSPIKKLESDTTLVSLFEKVIENNPDGVAVDFYDFKLTYHELHEKSNSLAKHLLTEFNLQPDHIVGILLEKSQYMIITILGILKAGASFLPIEPDFPEKRKQYILRDAKINLVVTDTSNLYKLETYPQYLFMVDMQLDHLSGLTKLQAIKPKSRDLAYVIYTSGSTGYPKGVMVEHASIANMCLDQIERYELDSTDNGLQFAKLSFDASIYEIFNILLSGATLVMIKNGDIADPSLFMNHIRRKRVTMVTLPPVYLNKLPTEQLNFLNTIVTAGEAANVKDALLCSQLSNYYNAYGPTECAVCVSVHKVNPDNRKIQNVAIGKPLNNLYVLILDENDRLVPIGIEGEICVGGIGLARGYLNKPSYTAQKFVKNPYKPEEKIYRTGDIGKWLENGEIEYVGRSDFQVKVRGFRIELGAVESIMRMHDEVANCVAVLTKMTDQKKIIAYWKRKADRSEAEIDFDSFLSKFLPKYSIPTSYFEVKTFPLTPNGKVDRKKLEQENCKNKIGDSRKPLSQTEIKLTNIWIKVLGIENFGVEDNFFDLGGNSINAITMLDLINKEFSENPIQISDLFTYKNIEQLAKILEEPINRKNMSDQNGLSQYSRIDIK